MSSQQIAYGINPSIVLTKSDAPRNFKGVDFRFVSNLFETTKGCDIKPSTTSFAHLAQVSPDVIKASPDVAVQSKATKEKVIDIKTAHVKETNTTEVKDFNNKFNFDKMPAPKAEANRALDVDLYELKTEKEPEVKEAKTWDKDYSHLEKEINKPTKPEIEEEPTGFRIDG